MARRKVSFLPGHYYHIYNRGANREQIFRNEENYVFLLRKIKSYASELSITIIAYCMMPNHYHFLVRQEAETPLCQFIQAVFNSYTKAFNKAFGRSGTLFEGPFQAIHIEQESHLLHLCRYIHRNPLDAGLVTDPGEWPFSNYLEWIGRRTGSLVDRNFVQEHFPSSERYGNFVNDHCQSTKITEIIRKFGLDA
jgi:putative transposase